MLDTAEALIAERATAAGLGCGLYADYGPALLLYLKRGYLPDGRGVVYDASSACLRRLTATRSDHNPRRPAARLRGSGTGAAYDDSWAWEVLAAQYGRVTASARRPAAGVQPPPLVSCPDCGGLTLRLADCLCRAHGDEFIIEEIRHAGGRGRPWPDCEVCGGSGSVARRCGTCRGGGRVRAQMVVSVANLDTGAVASAEVAPDTAEPVLRSWGEATIDLTPTVRDLAARVGATCVYDRFDSRRPLDEFEVRIGKEWDPSWPAASREGVIAAGLARQSTLGRWRIFLASSADPPQQVDPDQQLAQLCAAASALRLDLVVERREIRPAPGRPRLGWSWDVRLQPPGAPVPSRLSLAAVGGRDLASTLRRSDLRLLLAECAAFPVAAPARWIRLGSDPPVAGPAVVASPARRLQDAMADCGSDGPGAIATWRNEQWHISRVETVGEVQVLSQHSTGQVGVRRVAQYRAAHVLPAPDWDGGPIPEQPCPRCAAGNGWEPCVCRIGTGDLIDLGPPDPHCQACSGAGMQPAIGPCPDCAGTGVIRHGAVITVLDQRGHARHVNWRPPTTPPRLDVVGTTMLGGNPIVQLPAEYRLGTVATRCGIGVDELVEPSLHGAGWVDPGMRRGLITVTADELTDPAGVARAYLAAVAGGRPAARVILMPAPHPPWPLSHFAAVCVGLGLAVEISVDARLTRGQPTGQVDLTWGGRVTAGHAQVTDIGHPVHATLPGAVAQALERFEADLSALAHDAGPEVVLPSPDQPDAAAVDTRGVEQHLPRLAEHLRDGTPGAVMARFDPDGCHLYTTDAGQPRQLASAPTFSEIASRYA